jgi:hypothetical protein
MPRTMNIFCGAVCLLVTNAASSQALPRNPTIQQVVGYRMQQERQWKAQQLPVNSVLFQMRAPAITGRYYGFTAKETIHYFSIQSFATTNIERPSMISMYQNPYPAARITYSKYSGSQRSWWMDNESAIGSSILREIIINNNRY